MITDPPADPPDDETAARLRPPPNAASSEGGIDWPDRSHWSEFDLAIEAERGAADLVADPTADPSGTAADDA